ncbi:Pol polyprotein (Fragment), partial [Lemmus lemmus]
MTWFTDGSSFLLNRERKAGAVVVDSSQTIWATVLPPGTLAQRAELIALTQALKLAKVFVDTFTGWVEAFPTKKETAQVMTKKLLEENFPQYGMPKVLRSDNRPAFVSQVSQLVARLLGIDWKLHCAYRPQSSGQVERMNRTIKETLTKWMLKTGSKDWVQLLPLALYRARNTPGPHRLNPFEI